jgi:Mor family transcriptional regulator
MPARHHAAVFDRRQHKPFDDYKREWPRDLTFPQDVLARVAARWNDYGI